MITLQQYTEAKQLIVDYFKQQYPNDQHNQIVKISEHRDPGKEIVEKFTSSLYLSMMKHFAFKHFKDLLTFDCEFRSKEYGYTLPEGVMELHINIRVKAANDQCFHLSDFYISDKNINTINYWHRDTNRNMQEKQFNDYGTFEEFLQTYFKKLIKKVYVMWKDNEKYLSNIPQSWFEENNLDTTRVDLTTIQSELYKTVESIVSKHFSVENFKQYKIDKNTIEFSFDIDERGDALWRNSHIEINNVGTVNVSLHERYEGGDEEYNIAEEIEQGIKDLF